MFGSDDHSGHGHSHGPGGHSHEGSGNAFGSLFSSGDANPRMPSPPFMGGDLQRPSLTPMQMMQMRMQMMQHMQQMLASGGPPGVGPQFPIPLAGPEGMPRMPMGPGPVSPIGAPSTSGGLFSSSSPPPPTDSFQFSPWPNQDAPTTSESAPTTSQLVTAISPSAPSDSKAPATLPSSNLPERMMELVRATQFGLFDKVRELIEVVGIDVNQMDGENVSLLHWASINNRHEIVRYLIARGAQVDRIGGELKSTPLHWAVRNGHLRMVVLLMSGGADPILRDGEGYAAIHLAVQFARSDIAAYLLAKGCDPDLRDKNGMTPLMWACLRVNTQLDPARLLLTFNASPNLVDDINKQSAVHWAAVSGNLFAIEQLHEAHADFSLKNAKGQEPYEVAKVNRRLKAEFFLRQFKRMDELKKKGFPFNLLVEEKSTLVIATIITCISYLALGMMFDAPIRWWLKLLCIIGLLLFGLNFIRPYFTANDLSYKFGFNFASVLWSIMNFYLIFWPHFGDHTILVVCFTIAAVCMVFFALRTARLDPGILRSNQSTRVNLLIEYSERPGSISPEQLCSTCLLRRPLRSKHCAGCDRCVSKFDHHCEWLNCCVGEKNHRTFLVYVTFTQWVCFLYVYSTYIYWNIAEDINFSESTLDVILIKLFNLNSYWVLFTLLVTLWHTFWITMVWTLQLFQILKVGMTTNERINAFRYKHFQTGEPGVFRSPFNHGVLQNAADFFEFSGVLWRKLTGSRHPPVVLDWQNIYSVDQYVAQYSQTLAAARMKWRNSSSPLAPEDVYSKV